MIFGMSYLFNTVRNTLRSVFIWCFYLWVGEEAEGGDGCSRDCDYDCDCVVKWWEGTKIA